MDLNHGESLFCNENDQNGDEHGQNIWNKKYDYENMKKGGWWINLEVINYSYLRYLIYRHTLQTVILNC